MHAMTQPDDQDVATAWGRIVRAAGAQRKTKGFTVRTREVKEKPPTLPEDRRRDRWTGRDRQMPLKVKPAFHEALKAHAKKHSIGLAEMLERIVTEWEAAKGKGVANRFEREPP
jgi:hypothetical protein